MLTTVRAAASVQGRLYAQLERAPFRPALAFATSGGAYAWGTWEDLYRSAAGHAEGLAAQGLREGDVCVLVLPSGERCATLLVAALFLGAVPLLVAPPILQGTHSDLPRVLARVIARTEARLVIAPQAMGDMLAELGRRRPGRVAFAERLPAPDPGAELPVVTPRASALAALQLTSGTTGLPRICLWRQGQVVAALAGMARAMALSEDDVCFNWTPLYHDMGLVNNFLLCLANGVPLALSTPEEFVKRPAGWLRGLHHTGATITWSPNFGFALAAKRARDEELGGVRLDRVRAFWNAAERIHLDTMREFQVRFAPYGLQPDALRTNFGCAENVGGATFSDPAGPFRAELVDTTALQRKRIARPGAGNPSNQTWVVGVGRPCPGMTVKILSRSGTPLPDGHVGEVALQTPSRMQGYLRDARATRRALHGAQLRTGDLGYLRGTELFWVGRVRERITIRGQKFDPSDFERVLHRIPGLRAGCFVAFGVDDGRRGTQRVVVASEVRAPARPVGEIARDIRDRVALELGVTLDDVLVLPAGTLTKTSSGKRRHRYYQQLYRTGGLQSLALPQEE